MDRRHIERALRLGAEGFAGLDFRCIDTLSSGELGKADMSPRFDVRPHQLDVELTDASETGGLFGLRFD